MESELIDGNPPVKIGKVDEYLLRVLNKLIWIDCNVNDIYNMAKKERGRAKIELGIGALKQVYRNTLNSFLQTQNREGRTLGRSYKPSSRLR